MMYIAEDINSGLVMYQFPLQFSVSYLSSLFENWQFSSFRALVTHPSSLV